MVEILPTPIEKVILATGILNFIAAFFLFLTCRVIPGWRITKGLMKESWYQSIYKYHSYGWWLFIPSVILHIILITIHILSGG